MERMNQMSTEQLTILFDAFIQIVHIQSVARLDVCHFDSAKPKRIKKFLKQESAACAGNSHTAPNMSGRQEAG